MADVGDRIRIKYGLTNNPSLDQQRRWADLVDQLVRQGYTPDDAGRMAAEQVFPDLGTRFYKSESDTIAMLLQRIRDK